MEVITSERHVEAINLSFINRLPKSQRIVISLPNGKNLADILIHAYKKGVVSIPISPSASAEQIQFYTEHGEAVYYVGPSGLITLNKGYTHSKSDDAFIIYTSGSTGSPKGVVLKRQSIEQNAQVLSKIHNFKDGHATCLPFYHCNALMMSLIGSYLAKTRLVIQHAFNANDYFRNIKKYNIRTATIVPALLEELLVSAPAWPDCLEYLITAAAPLSQNLSRRFYKQYGPRLRQ